MSADRPPKPAGAPEGWADREPAGAPEAPAGPAVSRADDDTADGVEDGAATVEAELDELVADLRKERDEYLQLAQRARADFENFRKRSAREASEAERRGKAAIARQLVPALDNLERALLAAGVQPDGDAGADPPSREVSAHEALAEGVSLVLRELRETLGRSGVESYDPTGERFDPTWHEAVGTRPEDDSEAGVVVETLEKGYRLDGQVIRAARVIVSE